MTNRRGFLAGMVAATTFASDAASCLARASGLVSDRSADEVARDESYWAEIRRAFDSDRTLINLNHGGVAPAPLPVRDAQSRDLRFANAAPAH